MRFKHFIEEMAQPTEELRNKIFYHGTDSGVAAKSIWKNGLNIQKVKIKNKYSKNDPLLPIENRVYITPDRIYAIGFALGLNGTKNKSSDKYGYVFEFKGTELGDIQPDEDSIGESIAHYLKKSNYYNESLLIKKMSNLTLKIFPKEIIDKLKTFDLNIMALVGKEIVKHLSDNEKLEIISIGANIANEGIMLPNKMYRVNKEDNVIKLIKER